MKKLENIWEKVFGYTTYLSHRAKVGQKYVDDFNQWPLYQKSFYTTIIILFFISIFIFFVLEIQPTIVKGIERSQTLYLLSAVVQSLAAIAALVFTISLVVAQITSRYSLHVVKGFFDKYTLGYISLFIISILLLIWQLAETSTIIVRISLVLTSACLIFLLPFFLFIREKLDLSLQINYMVADSLRKLSTKKGEMPTEINTIENVIYSSFANSDYDTFETGVESLCKIALDFQANIKGDSKDPENAIARDILTKLKDISVKSIMDPRAPFLVAKNYRNVGVDGIKLKNNSIPDLSSTFLTYIGVKAADEKLDELIRWIVDCLTHIGFYAIEKKSRFYWIVSP